MEKKKQAHIGVLQKLCRENPYPLRVGMSMPPPTIDSDIRYEAEPYPTAKRRNRSNEWEEYKYIVEYDSLIRKYLVIWHDNGSSWVDYDEFDPPPTSFHFRKANHLHLKVGYKLFWWPEGQGCSEEKSQFRASVRRIYSVEERCGTNILDTNTLHSPSWHDPIQVIEPYYTSAMHYLRDFDFEPGISTNILSVGQTVRLASDKFRRQLKRKHPYFKELIQGDGGR